MKKLVLLNIILVATHLLSGQVYKSGTISSPESWSGTVYLSGNVTITSAVTIAAGTRVLFKGNRANRLVVDGTGSINANGTSGSLIYFSADEDEDGVYGENNERGQKMQFYPSSGSTGTSSFDYCIFEYIDCSNETGGNAYGALDISGRTVTINNSILRNNLSEYGGAIFIRGASTFTLSNSLLENNSADFWGGALYFGGSTGLIDRCIIRNNSAPSGGGVYVYIGGPTIQNCLIYSNSVTSAGSGIYLNQATSSLKIVNTTCSKNTNSGSSRDFQFSGISGQSPKLVNTAIWGSDIGSLDASLITVVNSAIQGFTNFSSHTSSISLSSNNTGDSNSPYFNDPNNFDWTLKFISPLRDAGVNSYTGVTIPTTDYAGNSRVLTTDIGAYEVQYSRWKTDAGSTDWSTAENWVGGVPTSTRDIIIPSGATYYPVGSSAPNVTVGSGKYFIMEPGSKATINSLTNSGLLRMMETSAGGSSLIMNSYSRSGGGTEDIQLYVTGGYIGAPENNEGRWHYISVPIVNYAVGTFTTNTLDLARWVDGIQSPGSIMEGFVAYDGFAYRIDDPGASPSTWFGYSYRFNTMTLGRGYNFWDNLSSYTYSLSGQLNTANVNVTLDYAGQPYENGFNLLGNPFTSGLDWDYVLENTSYPVNTSQAIYFTKDNLQYTYQSGVLIPDDGLAAPSGVIPPTQGFFVKTYAIGEVISLDAAARTHDDIPARYKGASIIPMLRLAMTDNGSSDETVVRFAEKAVADLDMGYDALKMSTPTNKTAIYTMIPGGKLSINGQPFLEPGAEIQIPVTVNVSSSGTHTISVKQLQSLDDYNITLKDNSTGFIANLKTTNELTFSAPAGLISDRFVLTISNMATGLENPVNQAGAFHIYYGFGSINIQTLADAWDVRQGSVRVIDLTGKTVINEGNVEFSRNSVVQVAAPTAKGLYVVEIRSGMQRYVAKIVIK